MPDRRSFGVPLGAIANTSNNSDSIQLGPATRNGSTPKASVIRSVSVTLCRSMAPVAPEVVDLRVESHRRGWAGPGLGADAFKERTLNREGRRAFWAENCNVNRIKNSPCAHIIFRI